jgi:hypothetical protein
MAFIPAPNCAEMVLIFTMGNQICANVFHLKGETPFDATSLATMAVLFRNWWNTNMKTKCNSAVSLDRIRGRALDTDHSPAVEVTDGMPIVGNSTFQAMPNNVTVAVKWQTGLSGRSYRGRTYHIGLTEEHVSANEVTPGAIAALTTAYNALLTAVNETPYSLVVLSRYSGNQPRETAVATEIDGVAIDTFIDSQRRRLPGRGR